MKTFQIITDSSCDLPQELADKLELLVLPLHFTIGGKTYANYLDGREIGFHDFFERIRQGEAASTSAANAVQTRWQNSALLSPPGQRPSQPVSTQARYWESCSISR